MPDFSPSASLSTAPAAAPLVSARVEPSCHDDPGSTELVRLSCDGERVLLGTAVELHPDQALPREPSKGTLERLAELLRARQDLLLVRIEVYAKEAGKNVETRGALLAEAQRRADALLRYLYRKQGISPERLEAAGYPFDAGLAAHAERWPVVIRVVQRARSRGPAND